MFFVFLVIKQISKGAENESINLSMSNYKLYKYIKTFTLYPVIFATCNISLDSLIILPVLVNAS